MRGRGVEVSKTLFYCIGDFVEISYAIKKEPLLRDSHQMPMVGLEPTRP